MQMQRGTKRKRVANDYKKRMYRLPKEDLSLTLSKWGRQIHRHQVKFEDTFTATYNGVATFTGKAWSFSLSDFNGSATLEALYDRYRLRWVKAEVFPRQNSVDAAQLTGTYTGSPSLVSVVDKDDDTTPASYNELLQYNNTKTHQFDKPFSRTFKPYAALAAYSGAFTSYASSSDKTWFDVASPDIRFYGFKLGTFPYSAANNGDSPIWDVIFTMYLEFCMTR